MEITKLSSRGQIVIPQKIRRNLKIGDPLLVTKTKDLIVLKKIKGITQEDLKTMKDLEKAWKDIEAGKGIKQSKSAFLKDLKKW